MILKKTNFWFVDLSRLKIHDNISITFSKNSPTDKPYNNQTKIKTQPPWRMYV